MKYDFEMASRGMILVYRRASNIRFCLRNLGGYNVGVTDVRNL
jgi:hypothetical protein